MGGKKRKKQNGPRDSRKASDLHETLADAWPRDAGDHLLRGKEAGKSASIAGSCAVRYNSSWQQKQHACQLGDDDQNQ